MAFLVSSRPALNAPAARGVSPTAARGLTPAIARGLLALAVLAGAIAAGVYGGFGAPEAVRAAGDDLTKLLRMMALLKAAMAAVLIGGVFWRLDAPVGARRLAAYAAACAAMAAGPTLIWSMTHVGLGAALLHGGLLAGVILLWRDPAVGTKLSDTIAARRSRRS